MPSNDCGYHCYDVFSFVVGVSTRSMNRLGDTKHEQVAWHSFSIPSAAGVPKQNCVTMVFTVLSPFQTSPTQQYCVTIVLHVPLQTSTTKRNCVTRVWQTSMTKQNCGTNLVADSMLQVLFLSLWGVPFSLLSTILGLQGGAPAIFCEFWSKSKYPYSAKILSNFAYFSDDFRHILVDFRYILGGTPLKVAGGCPRRLRDDFGTIFDAFCPPLGEPRGSLWGHLGARVSKWSVYVDFFRCFVWCL